MATSWRDSHFPPTDDDDGIDDVFETSPVTRDDYLRGRRPPVAPQSQTESGRVESTTGGEYRKLVTLNSLGGGRDSGYVPSPSSAYSFTFSSDEDEPKPPLASRPGITPPITIPQVRPRPARHHSPISSSPKVDDFIPIRRGRSNSCPEQLRSVLPPRLALPRFTATPTPAHGRTSSSPATHPDGRPLLTPPHVETANTAPRMARDALMEDSGRHCSLRRRGVLVLALPDLVADAQACATGTSTPPPSTPPSRPSRPRPRALSCEVTMHEEVGRTLRWIADSFHAITSQPDDTGDSEDESASVWRRVQDSFRLGFSSSLSSSGPA